MLIINVNFNIYIVIVVFVLVVVVVLRVILANIFVQELININLKLITYYSVNGLFDNLMCIFNY